jgi:hypothetical protein
MSEDSNNLSSYQYTPSDIGRLLQCALTPSLLGIAEGSYERYSYNGAEVGDKDDANTTIHRIGTRYVLPAVYCHKDPEKALLEVLKCFFEYEEHNPEDATEIIIPYNCLPVKSKNSSGHWYTVRILIHSDENNVASKRATVLYYDSLPFHPDGPLGKVLEYLLQRGYSHDYKTFFRFGLRQSDAVSCGPLTVETIKSLCRGETLISLNVSKEDGIRYKKAHRDVLKAQGYELDF